MIWDYAGPKYWICRDFEGYEIHAHSLPKKNAETVFDTVSESWVVKKDIKDRTVKKFNRQQHISIAMAKAAAYTKACAKIKEQIKKVEELEKTPDIPPTVMYSELEAFKKLYDKYVKDFSAAQNSAV